MKKVILILKWNRSNSVLSKKIDSIQEAYMDVIEKYELAYVIEAEFDEKQSMEDLFTMKVLNPIRVHTKGADVRIQVVFECYSLDSSDLSEISRLYEYFKSLSTSESKLNPANKRIKDMLQDACLWTYGVNQSDAEEFADLLLPMFKFDNPFIRAFKTLMDECGQIPAKMHIDDISRQSIRILKEFMAAHN